THQRTSTIEAVWQRAALLPSGWSPTGAELRQLILEVCQHANPGDVQKTSIRLRPERVQGALRVFHDNFAPVMLKTIIAQSSASELEQAHKDLRGFYRTFRWGLRHALELGFLQLAQGLPSAGADLGELLLVLVLALRRHGMSEEVERTAHLLDEVGDSVGAATELVVEDMRWLIEELRRSGTGSEGPAAHCDGLVEAFGSRMNGSPAVRKALGELIELRVNLWAAWKEKSGVGRLLEESAEQIGIGEPADAS